MRTETALAVLARLGSTTALALALGWAPVAWAAPPSQPTSPSSSAAETPPPAGDLSGDASGKAEARTKSPSAATFEEEGKAYEELGDYAAAAAAYKGWAGAAQSDAEKVKARASLQRVRDASRGRDETEPASTHRGELDAKWAPPPAERAATPKTAPAAAPADTAPKERIVTKWYFWVTIAAIAASAGAVAGIAIKASRDERKDSLDTLEMAPSGFGGPAAIRF